MNAEINKLLADRQIARDLKNYVESDRLRNKLLKLDVAVMDYPEGQVATKISKSAVKMSKSSSEAILSKPEIPHYYFGLYAFWCNFKMRTLHTYTYRIQLDWFESRKSFFDNFS